MEHLERTEVNPSSLYVLRKGIIGENYLEDTAFTCRKLVQENNDAALDGK